MNFGNRRGREFFLSLSTPPRFEICQTKREIFSLLLTTDKNQKCQTPEQKNFPLTYYYNLNRAKWPGTEPGNKYPPAKPGVLHRRVKPWITSARVTSRWYGLPAAKDCYLPPVNGLFRSFPLSAVRPPGLLLTGAGCILLSFYRFFLLYPHSILCTRTPYCDT